MDAKLHRAATLYRLCVCCDSRVFLATYQSDTKASKAAQSCPGGLRKLSLQSLTLSGDHKALKPIM